MLASRFRAVPSGRATLPRPVEAPPPHDILSMLVSLAEPCASDIAAEICPGLKPLVADLASHVGKVWVVEPVPGHAPLAAGVHDCAIEVAAGTPAALPLADNSVDLVLSARCFHPLPDCGKRQALREIHRILKPGGRLVFGDLMLPPRATTRHDRRVAPRRPAASTGPPTLAAHLSRAFSDELLRRRRRKRAHWWRKVLGENGFVDTEIRVLGRAGGVARATKA